MFYSDMDFYNHDYEKRKWFYKYIPVAGGYCGVGSAWDINKQPIFVIERVEEYLIEAGGEYDPPVYEPIGVETINVYPRLRRL